MLACVGLQIYGIIKLALDTCNNAAFNCGEATICHGYTGDVYNRYE